MSDIEKHVMLSQDGNAMKESNIIYHFHSHNTYKKGSRLLVIENFWEVKTRFNLIHVKASPSYHTFT